MWTYNEAAMELVTAVFFFFFFFFFFYDYKNMVMSFVTKL